MLEQKVWVTTSAPLYPNLYVFIVGDAGIGKTRPIMVAQRFLREIPEIHLGWTSMTMASLVDHLNESKRQIINLPDPMIEYNCLTIVADELSAFMDQYDTGLIAGLTTFYDVVPYSQGRRVKDIRIKIRSPQLNILSGSTPSNLIRFIPDFAWEQGFTSRVILVYSNDRPIIDVFKTPFVEMPTDMVHDLKIMNGLVGQFGWTEEFAQAMHNWKLLDLAPAPDHPKLKHYNSRRFAHQLKLAMIAAIDAGNSLMLDKAAFNKAMGWLLEAEAAMPEIFSTGIGGTDTNAMNEIAHFVQSQSGPISEHLIVNFARNRLPAHSVMKAIEIMQMSGMIRAVSIDPRTGLKQFVSDQ